MLTSLGFRVLVSGIVTRYLSTLGTGSYLSSTNCLVSPVCNNINLSNLQFICAFRATAPIGSVDRHRQTSNQKEVQDDPQFPEPLNCILRRLSKFYIAQRMSTMKHTLHVIDAEHRNKTKQGYLPSKHLRRRSE